MLTAPLLTLAVAAVKLRRNKATRPEQRSFGVNGVNDVNGVNGVICVCQRTVLS